MSRDKEDTEHRPAPTEGHEEEYALFNAIVEDIKDIVIDDGSYVHMQPRRIFIQVPPEHLREVIQYLKDEHDLWQMSTLSGRDLGDDLQACYHFVIHETKIALTIRVNVPRDKPEYPSITDLIPAAEFVENELREMFGVVPTGHPNPRRCELPENWPEEEYPLRKDWEDPRGLMKRSQTTGPAEEYK